MPLKNPPTVLKSDGTLDGRLTSNSIRDLYALIHSLESQIKTQAQSSSNKAAPLTGSGPVTTVGQLISLLKAGGEHSFSIQGLLGRASQPQIPYAPIVLDLPPASDPQSQDGSLVIFDNLLYQFDGRTTTSPGWEAKGGSVSSVALTVPNRLLVTSGSPVTSSGTITVTENIHTFTKMVGVNVTPVTASANSTSDQDLMTFTFGTADLNDVGKTVHVHAAGTYLTRAGQTPTIRFRIFMDGVQILNWQCNATTAATTDNHWEIDAWFVVTAGGVNGTVEAHGKATVTLGTVGGMDSQVYLDTITAVSGLIALNGNPVLKVTGRFDSQPGTPFNSLTQRMLLVTYHN
jgi:hypothetical protein